MKSPGRKFAVLTAVLLAASLAPASASTVNPGAASGAATASSPMLVASADAAQCDAWRNDINARIPDMEAMREKAAATKNPNYIKRAAEMEESLYPLFDSMHENNCPDIPKLP